MCCCTTELMQWKMSASTVSGRLWSWPIWQNCCQEITVKKLQWPKAHKDWTIEQWNNVESKFEIFRSSRRGVCAVKSWLKSCNPLYHTNRKALPIAKLHQVKGKLNQTGYHSITQHLTIPSRTQLVGQGFVLMQDNDPKHTSKLCQKYIKSKEEQHAL